MDMGYERDPDGHRRWKFGFGAPFYRAVTVSTMCVCGLLAVLYIAGGAPDISLKTKIFDLSVKHPYQSRDAETPPSSPVVAQGNEAQDIASEDKPSTPQSAVREQRARKAKNTYFEKVIPQGDESDDKPELVERQCPNKDAPYPCYYPQAMRRFMPVTRY